MTVYELNYSPVSNVVSIMMMLGVLQLIISYKQILISPSIVKLVILFGIIVLTSNILYNKNLIEYVSLLWILSFLIGYIIGSKYNYDDKLIKITTYFIVPTLALIYFNGVIVVGSSRVYNISDSSFVLLVLLPYVMVSHKGFIKTSLLLSIGILSFLSMKRSAIIAYLIAILIYFTIVYFKERFVKTRIIGFISSVLLFITLYLSYIYIDQILAGDLSFKMENMIEDRGSGRLDIYEITLEEIKNSTNNELLFGRGTGSTDTAIGKQAHNDFLTVFFEYGLFGFIVFLLFYYNLLKYVIRFIKRYRIITKREISYIASISILFVLGMLNCFVNNSYYFPVIMIFIGMSIGNFQLKNNHSKL